MKILITGATGLVGQQLGQSLKSEGHTIVALSRTADKARVPFADRVFAWRPEAGLPPLEALGNVEVVIHLAGESVAGRRWSDEQKRRIRDSRVMGTRNLVTAMQSLAQRPAMFLCASAVGFYGDREDELLTEQSAPGRGFLSEVCQEWEREAERATSFGIRTVQLRIGVALSPAGGALKQMLPIFKFGLAGKLGDGQQWFPWIHLDDVIGIIKHTMNQTSIAGPINVVAPGIVTNAVFTEKFANELLRPAFFFAPAFGLKLLMGEMAVVVLASQRATPKVALESGYQFRYPELQVALENLLKS